MIPNFPIYDQLIEHAALAPGSIDDEWSQIQSTMINLPISHSEFIYLLIIHHWSLEIERKKSTGIPYYGQAVSGKRGVIFNVMHIPPLLQRIILLYIAHISN